MSLSAIASNKCSDTPEADIGLKIAAKGCDTRQMKGWAMPTKLDDIELRVARSRAKGIISVVIDDADILALVAVARQAQNVYEGYARSDEYRPSIECLHDALAPLQVERGESSSGGGQ